MAHAWSGHGAMGVPSWSTYVAGCDGGDGWGDEDAERDPVIVGYVEHLGGVVKGLAEELRAIEGRQVTLDRRLAEFGGLLQGIQEEQLSQAPGQKAASVGAQQLSQHALNTAVAVQQRMEQEGELQACLQGLSDGLGKRLEQLCQQHGRWLLELSADVASLRESKVQSPVQRAGCTELALAADLALAGDQMSAFDQRLANLEQGQKTVAVGARRALHTALVVHQQQQSQDHDNQWEKCLDSLPVAELEQQCTQRFTEQDERLDKVLMMVDSLTDRVLLQQALTDGRAEVHGIKGLREKIDHMEARVGDKLEQMEGRVGDKIEALEAGVFGLASDVETCRIATGFEDPMTSLAATRGGPATMSQMRDFVATALDSIESRLVHGSNERDFVATALESIESRLSRSLNEVDQRLDALQDGRDQQRLSLRQISHQVPEVSQKLDQLWTQCQYYFPRVKEHDVHFGFFRTSFETHKQSMLDHADGIDQREHRAAAAAAASRGPADSFAPSPLAPVFPQQTQAYAATFALGRHNGVPTASATMSEGLWSAPEAAASGGHHYGHGVAPPTASHDATDFHQQQGGHHYGYGAAPPATSHAAMDFQQQQGGHQYGYGAAPPTASHAAMEPLASPPPRSAAEEDDAELNARSRMLAQIMARLHGRDDTEGAAGAGE